MLSPRDDLRITGLDGRAVFIVEDEALVALNLESMLEELGCVVAGLAMRFEQAETLIRQGLHAEAAVLDVNVGGHLVFPLAEAIRAQNIAIVFATGYGRNGIPEGWRGYPVLQKPYTLRDLAGALTAILSPP